MCNWEKNSRCLAWAGKTIQVVILSLKAWVISFLVCAVYK